MKTIEVTDIAKYLDVAPTAMCPMFIGDTGCGKTQTITQYAKDHNLYLKTLILSQLEASETLGIPVQSTREYGGHTYHTIDTAIPAWVFDLAEHQDDGAMLYLDEFLCSEPAVMNAFLNFLTERRVGEIDLSRVKIVAATNIGNYTYEPDNNILSRFCMFYVVNTTFQKYLTKKYGKANAIYNNYKDEEEKDSIIFERRSLKPRCQEMLMMLKDKTLLGDFYEGYTNTRYMPMFHGNPKINAIITAYVEFDETRQRWYLPDDSINNVASNVYQQYVSTSTRSNKVELASRYMDLTYDKNKLMRRIQQIIDGVINADDYTPNF